MAKLTKLTITRAELYSAGVNQLILVNGGGIVALLAFLQAIWMTNKELAGVTVEAILFLAAGLTFALLITPIRTRHMAVAHERELVAPEQDSRTWMWWTYISLYYISIICFLIGSSWVAYGVKQIL